MPVIAICLDVRSRDSARRITRNGTKLKSECIPKFTVDQGRMEGNEKTVQIAKSVKHRPI